MKQNHIIMMVVFVVIVGVGAFFAGMQYQKSQRGNFGGFSNAQGRQFGNGQNSRLRMGMQGARPVNGEILSTDDKSITVKMPDGSSKIVILSEKTTINKATAGTKSDLKIGERVAVFGTQNADGSMTAQNVSLGGMFRGMKGTATSGGQTIK